VLRSSSLHRGPWPSRCVHSVAPGSAQSCTADHSRLASLHLGASRAAQLAAASRPLAVPLREERRAWFRSKLHVGPRPPRVTPLRSVACCAARRCVAALGRPAACIASRLVQLEAARRTKAASRHSTSERRASRSSPLRRRTGGLATCRASRLVQFRAAHRSTLPLHLGTTRSEQLDAALRHLDVPLRA